jgi:multidrug efflux pump subunit AcrB
MRPRPRLLRLVQPRLREEPRLVRQAGVRPSISRSGAGCWSTAPSSRRSACCSCACPPPSCRTRTRASCSCRCRPRPARHAGRTGQVLDQISQYLLKDETAMVTAAFTVNGNNNAGRGQSQGQVFVRLKDWGERKDDAHSVEALSDRIKKRFAFQQPGHHLPDQSRRRSAAWAMPPASTSSCRTAAASATTPWCGARPAAGRRPQPSGLAQVRYNGWPTAPAFKIDIDREKAGVLWRRRLRHRPGLLDRLGLALRQQLPRHRQPHQARLRAGRRALPHESGGPRTPVRAQRRRRHGAVQSAFASSHWTYGPPQLQRYNGVESMN